MELYASSWFLLADLSFVLDIDRVHPSMLFSVPVDVLLIFSQKTKEEFWFVCPLSFTLLSGWYRT
jgi:hypothetical protein